MHHERTKVIKIKQNTMACKTTIGDWVISPYSNTRIGVLTTDDPNEVVAILMTDPAKPVGTVYTYGNNCKIISSDQSISKILIDKLVLICFKDDNEDAGTYCVDNELVYPLVMDIPHGALSVTSPQYEGLLVNSEQDFIDFLYTHGIVAEKSAGQCCYETFDLDENITLELKNTAILEIEAIGLVEDFNDLGGNPTYEPYFTGSNDGNSVVMPNIQKGYEFEYRNASTNSTSGNLTNVVYDLSDDLDKLVNPYIEVGAITGGASVVSYTPSTNKLILDQPYNSSIRVTIKGEVTTKGGNIATSGDGNMVSGIANALVGTVTLNGTALSATVNGTMGITFIRVIGHNMPVPFSGIYDPNNTTAIMTDEYYINTDISYQYQTEFSVNGILLNASHIPATMPTAGFGNPQEAIEWYMNNYPRLGAVWLTIANLTAVSGKRFAEGYVGTYYSVDQFTDNGFYDVDRDANPANDISYYITHQPSNFPSGVLPSPIPFGYPPNNGTNNELYIPTGQ